MLFPAPIGPIRKILRFSAIISSSIIKIYKHLICEIKRKNDRLFYKRSDFL
ncbi:shikimate kinase I [Mannheimia sp. USDA-ARS-USMARC-1261]|nr:shikimate kinase I [Mannheimia sp. USDA-ARS-USMARC-1261]